MNLFDKKLREETKYYPLRADDIDTLQLNLGYKCNLRCTHCHVDASPERTEEMSDATIQATIDVLKSHNQISTIIITGGAPELNQHFKKTIKILLALKKDVIVCSNLAIYSEKGMRYVPGFLAKHKVKIITSLPGYNKEHVDKQRGSGTYKKIISGLKKLNKLGYGKKDKALKIDIIFNLFDAAIAPDAKKMQRTYKRKLKEMHDVSFNQLITFSNMPVGRLGRQMTKPEIHEFIKYLDKHFNPDTVCSLMCRKQINVAPDGKLYDCGFTQSMGRAVKSRYSTIDNFNYSHLSRRKIATSSLCLLCTATAGTTCRCCLK